MNAISPRKPRPFRLSAPVQPEHELHAQVARVLTLGLPADAWHTAIDHWAGSAKETAALGAIRKARCVRAGLPDHWIIWRSKLYAIELKTSKGVLSDAQKACHAAMTAAGARVAVCRSIGDVLATLRDWGIPCRVKAA
jgi:hypothetical protein